MLADIEETIQIDAGVDRVWETMTTPELVEQWLGCMQFAPDLGSTFYMQPDPAKRTAGDIAGATHCELEALDRPTSMRFSWFMPGTPKTHVTIGLSALAPDRTEVRLTHSGWDQFDAAQIQGLRDMLAGGWKSGVLPGLKRVSESGTS